MRITKKFLSVFFAFVMMLSISSAIPMTAEAASLPKTSISSITAYPCGFNVNVSKKNNITGYQIQYATLSNFKNAKAVTTTGTSSAIRYRASATKYYIRVRTYKKSGNKYTYSAWSAKKAVTTLHKYASNPAHIKSLTAGPCSFTVKTYTSKNAAKYQARYSTNKNFSGAKATTSNSSTIKVTGRAANKTYYVQTRTYKTVNGKNYYSNWSPAKTVKTKSNKVTATNSKYTVKSSNSYIREVYSLVNKERTNKGISKLAYRNDLQNAANTRAREIATKFSHTRPNNTQWYTVMDVFYLTASENIAYGQRSAKEVMNAWMNSTSHKNNILDNKFTGIAVGYYEENGVKYWVQLFVG